MNRLRLLTGFAVVVTLLVSGVPAAMAADANAKPNDNVIVSDARLLSADEVRGADVTDSQKGQDMLQDAAEGPDGLDIGRRPYRAFSFGDQAIVVDAGSRLAVVTGLNSAGEQVFELGPQARASALSARAGYVVPPDSAWVYSNDGGYTHYDQRCDFFGNNCANIWKRTVYWVIDAAWNQGSYQYFRMYGRMQAQTITNAPYNPWWNRAYLRLDASNTWGGSPSDNFGEFAEPSENIAGVANVTTTIGFKDSISWQLGKPPVVVGGGLDVSYIGTLISSSEYWHPWVTNITGSGGVQYCKYNGNGLLNKKVATRVSIRQAKGAAVGYWSLGDAMFEVTNGCPGPG